MFKRFVVMALLVVLCLSSMKAAEKPNFVIVLADDVSWSSFGCVEAGLLTRTPNIDKLASQGMRFTNLSCSAAMCGPARQELYTGLLPPTSGIYGNGNKPKGDFKNLVNYLSDLDYNVGLTGKTHFTTSTEFPVIPGFAKGANDSAPTWELNGVKSFIEKSQTKAKPFCVVVASVHAHHPWTIGDPANFPEDKMILPPHMVDTPLTRKSLAIHAAEVEELDNQVGATMKLLDDMKVADNTVMIFLSEQGTAMPNGKYSIYDYGTKTLGLVRWPEKIKPSSVTDAVAMYCDITPTLVDIAGGEAPATDGKSLLPVLRGETNEHRKHAFLVNQVSGYTQRAIRNKQFKLIWNPVRDKDYYIDVMMKPKEKGGKMFAQAWREWVEKAKTDPDAQAKVDRVLKHPEFELYNVANDPWELTNLASNPEYSETLKQMHAQLKAEMKKLNDEFSTVDPKAAKKAKKAKKEADGDGDGDGDGGSKKKKREKKKESAAN